MKKILMIVLLVFLTVGIALAKPPAVPPSSGEFESISAATYGSDGSVTDAELLYINTLSSNAQDQLDARCLESVFGTAIGTGLTLDSTTLKTHTALQSIAGLSETNGGLLYGTADNTYAWLAAGAEGTLLMGNGAGAPSWLGAGTATYLLVANGAADPVWTAPGSLTGLIGANEAYSSGWNADTSIPEKDDIYDYLHNFDADDDGSFVDETWFTGLAKNTAVDVTHGDSHTYFGVAGDDTIDELFIAIDDALDTTTLLARIENGDNVRLESTTTAHEWSIQIYDVDNTTWRDALTFTNGDTPTITLGANVTFSGFSALDMSSGSIELPTVAGDLTLTSGQIGVDSAQAQVGIHDGTREVAIPSIQVVQVSFDPGSWYDSDAEVWLLDLFADRFPDGIVITKWYVDANVADPDVEMDMNLYYCDAVAGGAFPGGNAVLVDVMDTTTGNSSETDMANGTSGVTITLTGDAFVTTFGDSNSGTTKFIDVTVADRSDVHGWNESTILTSDKITRVSSTVARIDFNADALFDLTQTQTVSWIIPAECVESGVTRNVTPTMPISVETSQTQTGAVTTYSAGGRSGSYSSDGQIWVTQ